MTDVTVLLSAIEQGEARTEELLPMVYGELRRLAGDQMKHERAGQTLQATALVHEAFLRLVDDAEATWQNRRHFFGAAAIAMQRILVEQVRRKNRLKHGGERQRVNLSNVDIVADTLTPADDLLAIDEALQEFEIREPDKAELVHLRYFAGLTEVEVAQAMGISRATASRWWTFAKAWLFARIRET
ncbi:MAG: ECF-type sigma factor [Fuerstiella sp.]|nr:ECF-type sigma factor [Fuerstiella sp.]